MLENTEQQKKKQMKHTNQQKTVIIAHLFLHRHKHTIFSINHIILIMDFVHFS